MSDECEEASFFIGKRCLLGTSSGMTLDCMILDMLEEPGDLFLYEVLTEKTTIFINVHDVTWIEINEKTDLTLVETKKNQKPIPIKKR